MDANCTAPSTRPDTKYRAEALAKRHAQVVNRKLSTEELAAVLRVVQQTIRASLCRNGHYLELKPVKLPNGKLLWDAAAIVRLLNGEVA